MAELREPDVRAGAVRLQFLLAWLGLMLVATAWAITTPLGGSPDEPAHIIKAASVVRGELIGEATDQPAVRLVQVPVGIAQASAWPCYAFEPDQDASCMPVIGGGLETVPATTSAGLYNPMYYALVGWPSLFIEDATTAVMSMRLVSALIVSGLLAYSFHALLRLARPAIGGFAFFAFATPMVLFLASAVNPNALEIGAGAALFLSLLSVARRAGSGPVRWDLVMVAISGVLLANARGISPLWMVMIAVLVFLLVPWARIRELLALRSVWVAIGLLAIGAGGAAVWVLATGTLGSMGTFPGAGEVSPARAFVTMLFGRTLDPGLIGVFGWLDTFAPLDVYAIWIVLLGGGALAAFALVRGRMLLAALAALAAFLLAPPIVQALSVRNSGYIWQGRYTLVVLACLVIVLAVAAAQSRTGTTVDRATTGRVVSIVAVLVMAGQMHAFVAAFTRYAEGATGSPVQAAISPDWTPPGGVLLWGAAGAVGLALVIALWWVATRMVRTTVLTDSPEYRAAVR